MTRLGRKRLNESTAGKGISEDQYLYRGMPFKGVLNFSEGNGSTPVFASARDIGNVAAGYMAGNNGLSWGTARLGLDALESLQQKSFATEAPTTQLAQRVGYNAGWNLYEGRQKTEQQKQFKEYLHPSLNTPKE